MNHFPRHKLFPVVAKWLCALLAALALPLNAPAQPTSPERWLLVFDLSPAMKKRLPATEDVLKNFFATSAEGRLQEGDSIGVWTFDEQFHTGQFPLVDWKSNQATALTTNLIGFLRSQKFTSAARLSALQPALASVVGTVSTSVLRSSAQTGAQSLRRTTERLRTTRTGPELADAEIDPVSDRVDPTAPTAPDDEAAGTGAG